MSEEFVETLEDVVAYKIALSDLIRLFRPISNWLIGEGSFIRMNTDAYTVHTKIA